MIRLILSRLLQLPFILAVIFLVTFSLLLLSPGSPFDRNPDRPLPEVVIRQLEEKYKINDPVAFAWRYVTKLFGEGDFGPSFQYQDETVARIISKGLPVSATLGLFALIFALFIGITAGVIGAMRPGTLLDSSSLVIALIGVSLPSFVLASVLLVVSAGLIPWFTTWLGTWLPSSLMWTVPAIQSLQLPISGWGTPQHVILPAIALGAAPAAYIARLTRLGLADVMSSDFIRTARAKGLSKQRALFDHAMKVAFLPVLSFLGPAAAATMTGSFVIEVVFAIPGLGTHFVNSVLNNDRFLTLGLVLVYSTILVVFNLLVDVAYAWIDPRIEI